MTLEWSSGTRRQPSMVTATQHCISQLCHSIVQSVDTQNTAFPSMSLPPRLSPWSMPCAVHSLASPFTCLCPFLDTLLRISGVFIPSTLRRQLCFSCLTSSTFDLLDNMGLASRICWGFRRTQNCEAGSAHRAARSSARTQTWKV